MPISQYFFVLTGGILSLVRIFIGGQDHMKSCVNPLKAAVNRVVLRANELPQLKTSKN